MDYQKIIMVTIPIAMGIMAIINNKRLGIDAVRFQENLWKRKYSESSISLTQKGYLLSGILSILFGIYCFFRL